MTPNPFAAGAAFIDGEYRPLAEATLPITDWGFTRSDVTYDVVHVWEGAFFRLDDHLDRFEGAMGKLRLDPDLSRAEIVAALHGCVGRTGLKTAFVEMLCTRGNPPPGVRDPRLVPNRFLAYAMPFVWIANREKQAQGLKAVLARGVERISPAAVDPTVKNFHWLDLVQGLFEAYDRGAETVILTDGAGHVTEGPGFNVFAVSDGTVHTPDTGVLLGITRRTVLEICDELGVPVKVGPLPVDVLANADEVFISSTAGGIMPVTTLDDAPVGGGDVGSMTGSIQSTYWAWHEDPRFITPVVADPA